MEEVLITLKSGSSYVAPKANLANIKKIHGDDFSSAIDINTTIQKEAEPKTEAKAEAKTAPKKGGKK